MSHAVAHLEHGAGFLKSDLAVHALELLLEHLGYLAWINHQIQF